MCSLSTKIYLKELYAINPSMIQVSLVEIKVQALAIRNSWHFRNRTWQGFFSGLRNAHSKHDWYNYIHLYLGHSSLVNPLCSDFCEDMSYSLIFGILIDLWIKFSKGKINQFCLFAVICPVPNWEVASVEPSGLFWPGLERKP